MNKEKKQLLIIFCILFLINVLIFAIISFINWSWLVGFITGSIIGLFFQWTNEFYLSQLLSRRRTFKNTFFWSILKFLIFIICFLGLFILIIFTNKWVSNSFIDGVFNIFTFLYGISLFWISIIVFNCFNIYSDKIKKKHKGGK